MTSEILIKAVTLDVSKLIETSLFKRLQCSEKRMVSFKSALENHCCTVNYIRERTCLKFPSLRMLSEHQVEAKNKHLRAYFLEVVYLHLSLLNLLFVRCILSGGTYISPNIIALMCRCRAYLSPTFVKTYVR